jgi:hypothetical protein
MAALEEHLADPDTVVRRTVGALREEDDARHERLPSQMSRRAQVATRRIAQ